jgi:hypothetical protein
MRALVDRLFDVRGDTRPLEVARIGIGLLLLHEAWAAAADLRHGFFGARFHLPSLPDYLVATRSIWIGLIATQFLLALLVLANRFARPALLLSALANFYPMLADRLAYHNYRYTLVLFATLLAFAPCDRRERDAPLWAQRLAQLQVSIMYLASGGSKLLDDDWRNGRVFLDGITRFGPTAIRRGAPAAIVHWLQQPTVAATLARASIATELFLMIALWPRRTRAVALWIGVWFHLLIQLTTSVAIFSWLMLLIYCLFATTDHRARKIRCGPRATRALRFFDWLARFTVETDPTQPIAITDRDGTIATGADARILLLRTIPILFPLWLPFAAIRRATFRFRRRQPLP